MIETKGVKAFNAVNVILTGIIALLCVYPMIYVVLASFSNSNALMSHSGLLLYPLGFNFESYKAIFRTNTIINGFSNTFTIMIISLILNMVLTTMGAYVFSRKDLMLKKPLFILVLITMFFYGGIVPFYITVCNLGLYNTLWAVILPTAINTFNLIILRTSFEAIPDSLIEAAKIDGASDGRILFKIIVPLSKASMAVILLYYASQNWNAWFNASIFLRDAELYPLQLVLRQILLANSTDNMMGGASAMDYEGFSETIKYAIICVSTIPILALYPFLQKYFVGGVMVGAVKG